MESRQEEERKREGEEWEDRDVSNSFNNGVSSFRTHIKEIYSQGLLSPMR